MIQSTYFRNGKWWQAKAAISKPSSYIRLLRILESERESERAQRGRGEDDGASQERKSQRQREN